ncbi:ABC transporter substrate-binding protein, partial [Methylorubrum sp. DB1722]|nr:ABC transporter substrate-binding protein [Methylorubrum sp. DB1722]
TTKFVTERPAVARKIVMVLDEATRLAESDFARFRRVLPKYTAIKAGQVDVVAQPYLRSFADLGDTDLASYQALVDVFAAEGVLKNPIKVSDVILRKGEIGL